MDSVDPATVVAAIAWPFAIVVVAVVAWMIVGRVFPKAGQPRIKKVTGPGGWGLEMGDGGPAALGPRIDLEPEPVEAIPPPAIDPPSAANEGGEQEAASESSSYEWAFTKEAEKFESSFSAFVETDAYRKDRDFWETHRVARRRVLGIGGGEDEYLALAASNENFVQPYVNLAQRYADMGDHAGAMSFVIKAQERVKGDDAARRVFSARADIDYRLKGGAYASAYLAELLRESLTSQSVVAYSAQIARKAKAGGDNNLAIRMAEIALRANPADHSLRFDLAYMYSSKGENTLSLYHYNRLLNDGQMEPVVRNNIGVIMERTGRTSAGNYYYNLGADSENALSAANLAQNFVHSGFLDQARQLLERFKDSEDSEEQRANAQSKLNQAERSRSEAIEAMQSEAKAAYAEHQNIFAQALSYWCSGGSGDGKIFSADGLRVKISGSDAEVTQIGSISQYAGSLINDGFSFEGTIYEDGKTALTAGQKSLKLFVISDDAAAVVTLSGQDKWNAKNISYLKAEFEVKGIPED